MCYTILDYCIREQIDSSSTIIIISRILSHCPYSQPRNTVEHQIDIFIYLFIICIRPRRSITVKETTTTTNPSTDERKLKTTDK